MAYISLSGKNIYYEEYGAGNSPVLVYLHGGPGESCLTYSYAAAQLGKFYHVISFDQYGVFRSDPLEVGQKLGAGDIVRMTEELRAALGVSSWIPLGHSIGGMFALIYAHNYPESTDGVIYDCPMWSALHTARAIAEAVLPYFEKNGPSGQAALCQEILSGGLSPKEAFEKSLAIDLSGGAREYCHVITDDRYNAYIEEHISDPMVDEECWGRFMAFRQSLFESEDLYRDHLPYIAEIEKPQVLLAGEYDMTCGRYEQEWFAQKAPRGRTEILSGCAHLTWFEQPENYTQAVRRAVSFIEDRS